MKEENLRERIQANKEIYDEIEPLDGHEERFIEKLGESTNHRSEFSFWKIAAAAILLISIGTFFWLNQSTPKSAPVAQVKDSLRDPSRAEENIPLEAAEFYYENSIDQQLAVLDNFYRDKDSRDLIISSKEIIKELRAEYAELEEALQETGDERIVIAMINNYKSRIKILEELIQKLQYIKQLKAEKNENQDA